MGCILYLVKFERVHVMFPGLVHFNWVFWLGKYYRNCNFPYVGVSFGPVRVYRYFNLQIQYSLHLSFSKPGVIYGETGPFGQEARSKPSDGLGGQPRHE